MKSKESEDEQVNYMFFLNNNESSLQRTINKRSVAHYLWKDLLQIFFSKKKEKSYNSHRSFMSLSKDYTRQLNFIHKIPMLQFHC